MYRKDVIKPFVTNLIVFLSILCVIAIFWIPLNNFITIVFVEPFFCYVTKNSLLVQFAMLGLVSVYYCVIWRQLMREKWMSIRRIVVYEILFIYLLFRNSGKYVFFGIEEGGLGYVDLVGGEAMVIECIFVFRYFIVCNKKTMTPKEVSSFTIDKPTNIDELKRQFHASVLIEKIRSTFPESSIHERTKAENETSAFTVLLSERFGQGKSSFFMILKNICKKKGIDIIEFRPWLSNDSRQMIVNFFNLLREKIGFHDKELKRLLQTYGVISSDHIMGKISDVVSTQFYTFSMETQHDRIAKILQAEGKLRLVLIDDVDRLQAEELMALIKLIRNSADFPYIAYVIAADKDAIKETLRCASIKNPELYLKKFFNFELLFPADDDNVLGKLVDKITEILLGFGYTLQDFDEIKTSIDENSQYYSPVFANIRDVNRFCNVLSFELDLLKSMKNSDGVNTSLMKDIYVADLVKICMIQFVSPDLYKILRDYRFVLLEDYRHGKLVLRDVCKEYVETSDRMQNVQKVVAKAGKMKHQIDFEGTSQSNDGDTDKTNTELKAYADLLVNISPNEEELIKYLLDDLWGKTDSYVDLRKPCYCSQFFLYFSCRYRKNEMSDDEASQLFALPERVFKEKAQRLIAIKKESMLHKLSSIIEFRKIDRLLLLKNIIKLIPIDYSNYTKDKEGCHSSLCDFYKNQQYPYLIRGLIIMHRNETLDEPLLMNTLDVFYKTTNDFASSALALASIRPFGYSQEERFSFIFTNEQVDDLSKILIDRFFKDVFCEEPFGAVSIEGMPCMRLANSKYWENLFCNYVQTSDEPLEWLFRLFKIYDNIEGMYWDSAMVSAILGDTPMFDTFYERAERIVGQGVLQPYKEGMESINPNNTDFSTMEKIHSKPFSKVAYEWLTKHKDL